MREIDRVLEKGERIKWEGKPQRPPYMAQVVVRGIFVGVFLSFFGFGLSFGLGISLVIASGSAWPLVIGSFIILPTIFFVGVFVLNFVLGTVAYNVTYYGITNKRVITQTGIIGRDFRMTDLDRITNVDVNVGIFDRAFGNDSGTIKIFTPGTSTGQGTRPILLSNIDDPYDVFKLVNRASYGEKRDTYYPNRKR